MPNLVEDFLPGEAEAVTDGQRVAHFLLINPHCEFVFCERVHAVKVDYGAVGNPTEVVICGGVEPLLGFRYTL